MRHFTWVLLICSLAACQSINQPTSPSTPSPLVLPPSWTATPEVSALPTRIPTSDVAGDQSAPTLPPSPPEESTWLIRISAPPEWYGAEAMVELTDQTVFAMGPIRSRSGQESVWLARLTRAGEVVWVRTISMPEGSRFGTWGSAGAGEDATLMITGWYHRAYTNAEGKKKIDSEPVTLAIDKEGQILWLAPYASGSFQALDQKGVLSSVALGAIRLNATGELVWQTELDFGEAFSTPHPLAPPYAGIFEVQLLDDEGLIFIGNVVDVYYSTPSADRSGYSEGPTAYWYARFSSDGTLLWKHIHPFNPLQQSVTQAITTSDGNLVFAGYQSAESLSGIWLRKINPDGETIFHNRYLDVLDYQPDIHATPDGGLLLLGRGMIASSEYFKYSMLIKLDAMGDIEWVRLFPPQNQIDAALPLSDGSYLISLKAESSGVHLGFARLNTQGWPIGCPELMPAEAQIRVDLAPALFDEADKIPLALSYQSPPTEVDTAAGLKLIPVEYETVELCRAFFE